MRNQDFHPDDPDAVVAWYVRDGWSTVRIAVALHVHPRTIQRWLRAQGVTLRSRREAEQRVAYFVACQCGRMIRAAWTPWCIRCGEDLAAGALPRGPRLGPPLV